MGDGGCGAGVVGVGGGVVSIGGGTGQASAAGEVSK